MPRASRTSQAAAASALFLNDNNDESIDATNAILAQYHQLQNQEQAGTTAPHTRSSTSGGNRSLALSSHQTAAAADSLQWPFGLPVPVNLPISSTSTTTPNSTSNFTPLTRSTGPNAIADLNDPIWNQSRDNISNNSDVYGNGSNTVTDPSASSASINSPSLQSSQHDATTSEASSSSYARIDGNVAATDAAITATAQTPGGRDQRTRPNSMTSSSRNTRSATRRLRANQRARDAAAAAGRGGAAGRRFDDASTFSDAANGDEDGNGNDVFGSEIEGDDEAVAGIGQTGPGRGRGRGRARLRGRARGTGRGASGGRSRRNPNNTRLQRIPSSDYDTDDDDEDVIVVRASNSANFRRVGASLRPEDQEQDEDVDDTSFSMGGATTSTSVNRNNNNRRTGGGPVADNSQMTTDHADDNDNDNNHDNDNDNEGISLGDHSAGSGERSSLLYSSRMLNESEDEAAGGTTTMLNGEEGDSLADASDGEVEARALENLGWNTIGLDKELPIIDLERWKKVTEKHNQPGTDEYNTVKEIQGELLKAVQELEATEWMFPEPEPFIRRIPEHATSSAFAPSATTASGQRPPGATINLPFPSSSQAYNNWVDSAFNPLSTFTPLAPSGMASYPDTYRVQRALGRRRNFENVADIGDGTTDVETDRGRRAVAGRTGEAKTSLPILIPISEDAHYHATTRRSLFNPRKKPDLSFLDVEAKELFENQETSFAAKAKFPWATPLTASGNMARSASLQV